MCEVSMGIMSYVLVYDVTDGMNSLAIIRKNNMSFVTSLWNFDRFGLMSELSRIG